MLSKWQLNFFFKGCVCACVCVCVCVCVYMYIYMYVYTYTCIHIYTCICTHTHMHTIYASYVVSLWYIRFICQVLDLSLIIVFVYLYLSSGEMRKLKVKMFHWLTEYTNLISWRTHVRTQVFRCLEKHSVLKSLKCLWLFVTPWTAALQVLLSSTVSWSLVKFISIELVMLYDHLILCQPFLLLPSVFLSIRFFSN